MAFDEPADLIGSCEATLDTLGLLVGDIASLVRHMAAHDSMPAAQIARRLSGRSS